MGGVGGGRERREREEIGGGEYPFYSTDIRKVFE